MMPISDPLFYAVAIPAVVLVGLSKGGLGSLGVLGVPLMALVISPVQAAAIMLPILILMDIVSLSAWKAKFEPKVLRVMLPGALVGIGLGWAFASKLSPDLVRLALGLIAIGFVINAWRKPADIPAKPHQPKAGLFWGGVAGLTSFIAHAGGPPYKVYTVPLKMPPTLFASTSVCFFAIINAVKLVPYFALGQFDATNLATSAVLLPIAPLATLAGVWIVRRMEAKLFYQLVMVVLFVTGLKLIWDGIV